MTMTPDRNTTIEVDSEKLDGCEPQVAIRIYDKRDNSLLAEALFNPDRADELAADILRLANNVRNWINT